jgi:hypothetical protein
MTYKELQSLRGNLQVRVFELFYANPYEHGYFAPPLKDRQKEEKVYQAILSRFKALFCSEVYQHTRQVDIVQWRGLFWLYLRSEVGLRYTDLSILSGYHHTTIIYHVEKLEAELVVYPKIRKKYAEICKCLSQDPILAEIKPTPCSLTYQST